MISANSNSAHMSMLLSLTHTPNPAHLLTRTHTALPPPFDSTIITVITVIIHHTHILERGFLRLSAREPARKNCGRELIENNQLTLRTQV
jgi:hypothetical protein